MIFSFVRWGKEEYISDMAKNGVNGVNGLIEHQNGWTLRAEILKPPNSHSIAHWGGAKLTASS